MRKIYVADFETTPFDFDARENYILKPLFLIIKDCELGEYFTFILKDEQDSEKLREFLLKLCNSRQPSRIYFHNLKFDIHFLLPYLPKTFRIRIIAVKSRFMELRLFREYIDKNGKKTRKIFLDIRDSVVLLLSSIKELGEKLGFLKDETEYSGEITPEFLKYCRRDCDVLEMALLKLCETLTKVSGIEIKFSKLPLTLPSLSKKIWLQLTVNKYGKEIVNKIFDIFKENYEDLFRQYYFGGRVEVFDFNRQTNVVYNDFNSFYSSIMKNNKFPLAPYNFFPIAPENTNWEDFKQDENIFGAFCYITENQEIPLVPIKFKEKTIYPNGFKESFLFREEIEYLLELKQEVKLKTIVKCDEYIDAFHDFVELFYQYRISVESEIEKYLMKIFLNALYGKFAEKSEKEEIEMFSTNQYINEVEIKCNKIEYIEIGEDNYYLAKSTRKMYIKTNIIWGMRISALARLELHKSIMKSLYTNSFVYYCDSDSLVTKNEIEISKELGHLKPELYCLLFQPLGCKEYAYTTYSEKKKKEVSEIKQKGFQKSVNNLDLLTFVQTYFEKKWNWRLSGIREIFNRDLELGEVQVFEKKKISYYDKRWILNDLTTKPFHLQNDSFENLLENNKQKVLGIIQEYKKYGIDLNM